jgi:hypothetical protein
MMVLAGCLEGMVRMEMIDKSPRGIGGWLILTATGLVALPLLWIYSLWACPVLVDTVRLTAGYLKYGLR